jgi:phosphoribosylanthranilate isomerase
VSTWIKICGITRPPDALRAAEAGADAVGFVFHARSPRRCDPRAARHIIRALPASIATVGVWLDEDARCIEREADEAGVQLVQTYAPEVAQELADRRRRVILAIDPHRAGWDAWTSRGPIERLLLDRGRLHGTASAAPLTAADLAAARRTFREAGASPYCVILAGGLTPQNVAAALRDLRPDGVDVASGIESAPGLKDPVKLAEFISEVRQWDAKVTLDASADNSSPRP